MARKVLFINGHDYSDFVAEDGYQWEDNDIDGNGAGRAMDTMMDRDLLADKTKLQISCRDLLQSESSAILTDIKQEFYEATVLDAPARCTPAPGRRRLRSSGMMGKSCGLASVSP